MWRGVGYSFWVLAPPFGRFCPVVALRFSVFFVWRSLWLFFLFPLWGLTLSLLLLLLWLRFRLTPSLVLSLSLPSVVVRSSAVSVVPRLWLVGSLTPCVLLVALVLRFALAFAMAGPRLVPMARSGSVRFLPRLLLLRSWLLRLLLLLWLLPLLLLLLLFATRLLGLGSSVGCRSPLSGFPRGFSVSPSELPRG